MVPSLDVQPGEVFPVRLDLQLTRPFNAAKTEGAMVQVSLDCAIFSDLSTLRAGSLEVAPGFAGLRARSAPRPALYGESAKEPAI